MEDQDIEMTQTLIAFTSNIVEAYVSNNSAELDDVPVLINNVYSALSGLSGAGEQEEERPEPAVSIRASVKPDYLVCLEDGKKLKKDEVEKARLKELEYFKKMGVYEK